MPKDTVKEQVCCVDLVDCLWYNRQMSLLLNGSTKATIVVLPIESFGSQNKSILTDCQRFLWHGQACQR